ncbi:MAG: winged helix-turn-helix domain-containing protein [Dehalococcoidia bacterium]
MTVPHLLPEKPIDTVATLRELRALLEEHDAGGARLRALVPAIEAIIAGTPSRLAQCPECGHAFDVMHTDEVVRSGDLVVNLTANVVTRAGEHIHLSRREWDLLAYLVRRPGHVVHHNELLTGAFGPEYRADLRYLRVWISRVRGRIGAEYLVNEAARGNRFVILPVRDGAASEEASA